MNDSSRNEFMARLLEHLRTGLVHNMIGLLRVQPFLSYEPHIIVGKWYRWLHAYSRGQKLIHRIGGASITVTIVTH